MEIYRPVSGVTVDKDQARLAILKVPDKPGVAGEIFSALAHRREPIARLRSTIDVDSCSTTP